MNYYSYCPVCQNKNHLKSFSWGNYNIKHCRYCKLDYCSEMIKKEVGGDSSPVPVKGINMMAKSFYKTNKLAFRFATKRKYIYDKLLNRNCINILEVGCGPGVFFKPWSDLNVEWKGIDINSFWKEFGNKNQIPISDQSIESITEKFDVITAHQVIEHVENPISFTKNLKILLKPGGLIHLELPNQNSLTSRLRQISSKVSPDYGFIQPPMHLRAYRKQTIQFLFDYLNLKSKMIFVCGNTDKVWGQVRKYNITQKLIYNLSGRIGMGSLLIGIAKSN